MKVGVLIDSYLLNKTNLAICHEAVLVDGDIFSLETDNKQKESIIIKKCYDSNYSWKYKGKCQRTKNEIEIWINS